MGSNSLPTGDEIVTVVTVMGMYRDGLPVKHIARNCGITVYDTYQVLRAIVKAIRPSNVSSKRHRHQIVLH